MTTRELFCGEALCKKPVRAPTGAGASWPIRCEACGTALYPADVLARMPANELEPKRGTLMTSRGGIRSEVVAADLGATTPASGDADIDSLLAKVDLGGATPAPRKPPLLAIAVAVVVALALVAFLASR